MPNVSDDEMLAPAPGGRVFEMVMRPGLGDCAPSGRIRLDALARWLQDVAYGDVEDAQVAAAAVWVVRRTRILVRRFPRFGERCSVRTFCSGLGRMWAERRTTIAGPHGQSDVEAVALWVHLDPQSRRPTPLGSEELAVYGALGHDRRVSARLRHPPPGPAERETDWIFRATDCDLADHVNNAAYWEPLEEELLRANREPGRLDVEIEFRTPAQPGPHRVLAAGSRRWLTGPGGEVHASLVLAAP